MKNNAGSAHKADPAFLPRKNCRWQCVAVPMKACRWCGRKPLVAVIRTENNLSLVQTGECRGTIRVATSVVFEDDQPCPSLVDILRIGPDDDHWEILDEGEWNDDGPPAEFFEYLEEAWEDNEDAPVEEWADDRTIAQLSISVETYNKLDEAGLETIDEVAELKEKTLRVILGEHGLAEVRDALAVYGMTLVE